MYVKDNFCYVEKQKQEINLTEIEDGNAFLHTFRCGAFFYLSCNILSNILNTKRVLVFTNFRKRLCDEMRTA